MSPLTNLICTAKSCIVFTANCKVSTNFVALIASSCPIRDDIVRLTVEVVLLLLQKLERLAHCKTLCQVASRLLKVPICVVVEDMEAGSNTLSSNSSIHRFIMQVIIMGLKNARRAREANFRIIMGAEISFSGDGNDVCIGFTGDELCHRAFEVV
eukprot:scaffold261872_cov34-Prasinocladus_malaysianus.AAC.1